MSMLYDSRVGFYIDYMTVTSFCGAIKWLQYVVSAHVVALQFVLFASEV